MNNSLIGVEYHRELSADKLFCRCHYTKDSKNEELFYVMDTKSEKINTYCYNSRIYCDYEKDEKPPLINSKIVKKACQIVKQFPGAKIVDNLVFMRKEILDGSLPSGYQISGLLATGGNVVVGSKTIAIKAFYLQQDSSTKKDQSYDVGRLGVPLLQITTEKDNLTPEETVELLKNIEQTVNFKKNLPKGANVIRQDLNISTPGHPRVEIKGVDKLSSILKVIPAEICRQQTEPSTIENVVRKFSPNQHEFF